MNYLMKRILCLLTLALYIFNTTTTIYAVCIAPKYTVRIENDIANDSIRAHCKSKNKDLGDRILPYKGNFQWEFCQNYFQTTLYFCHFYWKSKQQVFDVFNKKLASKCFFGSIAECSWVVKDDGFYYYNFNTSLLIKTHDWN